MSVLGQRRCTRWRRELRRAPAARAPALSLAKLVEVQPLEPDDRRAVRGAACGRAERACSAVLRRRGAWALAARSGGSAMIPSGTLWRRNPGDLAARHGGHVGRHRGRPAEHRRPGPGSPVSGRVEQKLRVMWPPDRQGQQPSVRDTAVAQSSYPFPFLNFSARSLYRSSHR